MTEHTSWTFSDSRRATPAPLISPGKTILVVDDESNIRFLVSRMLVAEGYTVLEDSSGPDALATCKEYAKPIHLLITDYSMPVITGSELIDHVIPLRPAMKILCLSASEGGLRRLPPQVARMSKPFTLGSLRVKVKELLGARVP
jgi:CheY-like chemotaxis protein